jgi:hypothetical protein
MESHMRILADLTQQEAKQITPQATATQAAPVVKPRMAFKKNSIQHFRKAGDVRPPVGTRHATVAVAACTHARTERGFGMQPSVFGKRTNLRTNTPYLPKLPKR